MGPNRDRHRATYPAKQVVTESGPVVEDGERRWAEWQDLELDDSDFAALGADFAATGLQAEAPIGAGTARLMRQRAVVDFAVEWMARRRS